MRGRRTTPSVCRIVFPSLAQVCSSTYGALQTSTNEAVSKWHLGFCTICSLALKADFRSRDISGDVNGARSGEQIVAGTGLSALADVVCIETIRDLCSFHYSARLYRKQCKVPDSHLRSESNPSLVPTLRTQAGRVSSTGSC